MSYLYSKLPETGVPLLIGTGGSERIIGLLSAPMSVINSFTLADLIVIDAR